VTTFERRQNLLELMRKQTGLSVPEFAEILKVSQGTVRNDLNALADQKLITRVRGGGTVPPSQNALINSGFSMRLNINDDTKRAIGREAAKLVQNGDAILLDASTTVFHMAQFLVKHNYLRVITNGIEVARLLAQNPTNTVMVVGGMLKAGSQSVLGPWSEQFLKDICTKMAFVSCSGFTPAGGMTEVDVFEAQFRIHAIGASTSVIALIDSEKFGKIDLTPSLRIEQISHLFTDSRLKENWVNQLKQTNIVFNICSDESSKN
jgi:DeoR/GlpR family transcriptional regulator of sugar metabolism